VDYQHRLILLDDDLTPAIDGSFWQYDSARSEKQIDIDSLARDLEAYVATLA